jgi:hypothetical protein
MALKRSVVCRREEDVCRPSDYEQEAIEEVPAVAALFRPHHVAAPTGVPV